MSTYAQLDTDGNQYHVASNLGWSEFGDWCESLDHTDYPLLVQLWEHGQSNDPKGLAEDIENALVDDPPNEDVAGSCELLLNALHSNRDAESIYITQ